MIWLAAGFVALVVLTAAVVVLIGNEDPEGDTVAAPAPVTEAPATSPPTTESPAEIDAAIEAALPELQAFVEEARGLEFTEPVDVEVLDAATYEERAREEFREDTAEFGEDLERAAATYQALGLLDPDVDIIDTLEQFLSTGTAGVYRPDTKELVVLGSELNANLRVTLVHELTHALDDQRFGLERPELEERVDEAEFTFSALVEGNATRVEQEYVDSLDPSEQLAYLDQAAEAAGAVDFDAIPRVLLIENEFLYGIGYEFVQALDDVGGNERIDEAFDEPPLTTEAILEPESFLDGEGRERVPAPEADGEIVDEGIAGQFQFELLVNGRLGGADVPEWTGDQYVVWEDGEGTCVRIAYGGDLAAIEDSLSGWADRTGGSVERTDETVTVTGCTP